MAATWTPAMRARARREFYAYYKASELAKPDIHPVRRARLAQDLTLSEVAAKARISPAYLGSIERRDQRGSPRVRVLLSAALDIDEVELFPDDA